jgi:lipopolysaccharide/colanic/teichoic acid biosynthesis glycosyltransferase
MKRLFDIAASGFALLVLSPLLLPIMLALRLTGEGEIFYYQKRVGRSGARFDIFKFATMLKNSPNMAGGDITTGNDPRVLPMGHFLRKTKINELPQLINIVRGDMSVIGPRPLTPRVAALFPAEHWTAMAKLRPGLSGIGSIVFRDEEDLLRDAPDREKAYAEAIVPYKVALERWYAQRVSLWLDMKLIALTILAVLRSGTQVSDYLRDLPPPPPALVALRRDIQT